MPFLGVQMLFRRAALDARLAEGETARPGSALARRAAHLRTARARCRVASGLERALADRGRRFSAAVPVDQSAVASARLYLVEIIEQLRSSRDVTPHGVARAGRLLTHVGSPLYVSSEPSDLRDESRLTLFWLDPAPDPSAAAVAEERETAAR